MASGRTQFRNPDNSSPFPDGRDWTVSVAVPSSIIANLSTAEQRVAIPGRIARALAIFSIDEVVIFDDSPMHSRPRAVDPDSYTGDTDPCHFIAHVLMYLESPPFMRKALFPLHPNLRMNSQLPSLDMPHHPHPKEWMPYAEGISLDRRTSTGKGSLIDVGLGEPMEVKDNIPPGTRVTLRFPDDESQPAERIHPDIPRTEGGFNWGYKVRKCASLSAAFTESPYEDGYDLTIGTSERGTPLATAFPPNKSVSFKHLMIVFGGPRGLEYACMNDEELSSMGIQGGRTKELFDQYVNILPGQGSRAIRTEEALLIGLTAMRSLWDSE